MRAVGIQPRMPIMVTTMIKAPISSPKRWRSGSRKRPIATSSSGICGSVSIISVKRISGPSIRLNVACQQADGRAHENGDHHGRKTDRQRDASTVQHARQHIAPQIVGAHGVLRRRWLAGGKNVDGLGVDGVD